MSKKRKKPSKLQSEYRKQRRRIQNLIASYRRKGYDVQFELPAIPKRITQASVRRLAKIKPETVQEKTYGIDYETGEQISYYRAQSQRRLLKQKERQTKKPVQTKQKTTKVETLKASTVIIRSFRYQVSQYPPSAFLLVSRWLDAQIETFGAEAVSRMLQQGADAGLWLTPKEAYKEENIKMMLNGMMDFIGLDEQEKQEFMESIDEEFSTWGEY